MLKFLPLSMPCDQASIKEVQPFLMVLLPSKTYRSATTYLLGIDAFSFRIPTLGDIE